MSQELQAGLTQFLTFRLSEDVFAIDVVKAREVLDFAELTQIPQAPDYIQGVINLRGMVVPVVDMRLKFGMENKDKTRDSCIIVVEVDIDGSPVVVGALADSVEEVRDMEPSQIEPPPQIGTRLNTDFIKGMGNLGEKFVIILDIDRVFAADDIAFAGGVSEKSGEAVALQ